MEGGYRSHRSHREREDSSRHGSRRSRDDGDWDDRDVGHRREGRSRRDRRGSGGDGRGRELSSGKGSSRAGDDSRRRSDKSSRHRARRQGSRRSDSEGGRSRHSRKDGSRRDKDSHKRSRRESRRESSSSESAAGGRGGAGVASRKTRDGGSGHHSRRPTRTGSDKGHRSDSASSRDDSTGHFNGEAGDRLGPDYEVEALSGTGTFGKVFRCRHRRTGAIRAIKVVRRIKRYSESALVEARVLDRMMSSTLESRKLCVHYYSMFEHKGHVCLVFEQLAESLYDYIKLQRHRPLPLYCVQAFAEQLIRAVAFMSDIRLIHTDLKPENILLQVGDFTKVHAPSMLRDSRRSYAPAGTQVRVIDFGGATFEDDHHSRIINTRQYRSPEVILGLGWSYPSDVWSAACIIMELYAGELLFATHDNGEHLALMQKILGPIPRSMALDATNREVRDCFTRSGELAWPDIAPSSDSVRTVDRQQALSRIVHPDDDVFLDLIVKMLRFDPRERITAHEALEHRFFTSVRDASSLKSLQREPVVHTRPPPQLQ